MHYPIKGKLARQRILALEGGATALVTPAAPPTRSAGLMASYALRRAATRQFQPSAEQQAYFRWITHGQGSVILRAVAGAGKSTTLVQGLPYMDGSIMLAAFGKDAAEDIRAKAHAAHLDRQGIRFGTMHAAGYRRLLDAFPGLKNGVDDRKVGQLIDTLAREGARGPQIMESKAFIAKMVSYAKQFLIGCPGYPRLDDMSQWERLSDHFSMDQDLADNVKLQEGLEWAQEIMARSIDRHERQIDFDDMLYIPIWLGLRMFPNDWFLGDEWQDANAARRQMARMLLRVGGRGVFVGDDRQAIFGFTGADTDSLEVTAKMFNCAPLSLSVTYRCPKSVVAHAKGIDPDYMIVAHPSAPEGLVRPLNYSRRMSCMPCDGKGNNTGVKCEACFGAGTITNPDPWFMQDKPDADTVILCRYTRPLLATAYAMIRQGIACKVEGRDIGKGLITLATRWRSQSLDRLEERLKTYLIRETIKAKDNDRRLLEIEDRVGSLQVFIERCRALGKRKIDDLVNEINIIFADNIEKMITLSTGHKFKGRERPRVYWLQTVYRGRPMKEWEQLNERNIRIVITTRSQSELVLVPEEFHTVPKKKEK